MIEIVDPGRYATVQDLGRAGYAALGVPGSGAFDRSALRAANRLVGNAEGSAGIENVLGGLHVRALTAVTVSVTGAGCVVHTSRVAPAWGTALTLPAGAELRLDPPRVGLRCYLGVRGGIRVQDVLGSASTDTMGGLGPAPLGAGDRLATGGRASVDVAPGFYLPNSVGPLVVRLGPRDDWFTDADGLFRRAWVVRTDSDRVGVRLDGPPLTRARGGELPSEPVRPGAVQVPGDGRPIVFGPDAPTTGGYPVIGVVTNVDAAAQLRPGDTVRFVRRR